MSADIVTLPGSGKTIATARARMLGLVDEAGNFTEKAYYDERQAKAAQKEARAAEWRRTQGLGEPAKVIEPLRPRNVTPDGDTVTDPAILAAIAERTAQIEAVPTGPVFTGRFTGVGVVTNPTEVTPPVQGTVTPLTPEQVVIDLDELEAEAGRMLINGFGDEPAVEDVERDEDDLPVMVDPPQPPRRRRGKS